MRSAFVGAVMLALLVGCGDGDKAGESDSPDRQPSTESTSSPAPVAVDLGAARAVLVRQYEALAAGDCDAAVATWWIPEGATITDAVGPDPENAPPGVPAEDVYRQQYCEEELYAALAGLDLDTFLGEAKLAEDVDLPDDVEEHADETDAVAYVYYEGDEDRVVLVDGEWFVDPSW